MPDSESMLQHAPLLLSVSGMFLTRHRPFPADIVFSGTDNAALLMARHREFDTDQAIQEAVNTFWAQGYNATSMRGLATSTGVLTGSLHAAFGGKKELFLAALDRYIQDALIGISDCLGCSNSALDGIRQCLIHC